MAGVFVRERMAAARSGRVIRPGPLRLAAGIGEGVRARVGRGGDVTVWQVRKDRHEMFAPVFRGRLGTEGPGTVTLTGVCRLDRLGWTWTAACAVLAAAGALVLPDRGVGLVAIGVAVTVVVASALFDRRSFDEHRRAIARALPAVLAEATESTAKVRKREHRA